MGRRTTNTKIYQFQFLSRFLVSFLLIQLSPTITTTAITALPLHTDSRWIVDEAGARVKLACVSWPSHLEPVVAEGLSKQPMGLISRKIRSMGFNCVRLTWPLYLATDDSLASLTVRQSFERLGLSESVSGLQANNPSIVDRSLITAFQAVVSRLAEDNVMVILDNHISTPGWCCSYSDDNGFFGDKFFDPDLWVQGLTKMVTLFKNQSNVVGISLRNELRGPRQNVGDWYRYMQMGAEAVHSANPDVLVIISGLNFDTDLSFLHDQPLNLSFTKKLVFEAHWYSFTDGQDWRDGNPNQVCGRIKSSVMRRFGFLLDRGWPLFLSEFGLDLRGGSVNDERYFACFSSVAAELDFDWALWNVVGSYYLREGVVGMDECYGMLSWDWSTERNPNFSPRISFIQSPLKGPGVSEPNLHKVIFHPMTGLCVLRRSLQEPLELGPCSESAAWSYTPQKTLMLKGTYSCLQASDKGKPVTLARGVCRGSGTSWKPISDSEMHLSTELGDKTQVCLDVDPNNKIVTSTCKCLSEDNKCDPESQWFKLVETTGYPLTSSINGMISLLDFPWMEFLEKLTLGLLPIDVKGLIGYIG